MAERTTTQTTDSMDVELTTRIGDAIVRQRGREDRRRYELFVAYGDDRAFHDCITGFMILGDGTMYGDFSIYKKQTSDCSRYSVTRIGSDDEEHGGRS